MSNDIQRIGVNTRLAGCVVHSGLVYVSGQVPTTLDADAITGFAEKGTDKLITCDVKDNATCTISS